MKWIPADIEMYKKSAEYVDTMVLPLLPVSFDEDMQQYATMTEFVSLLTGQLERQFKGRIFLLPGYSYIKNNSGNLDALLAWEKDLLDKHFKHVFYVTSDSDWKQFEDQLNGSLLWIPSLPLDKMEDHQKVSIIEDQVNQLLTLFIRKWRENE